MDKATPKLKKRLILSASLSVTAIVVMACHLVIALTYIASEAINLGWKALYEYEMRMPVGLSLALCAICAYTYNAVFNKKNKGMFEKNADHIARDAFLAISVSDTIVVLAATESFGQISEVLAAGIGMFSKTVFVCTCTIPAIAAASMAVLAGVTAYRIHKESGN